MSRSRKTAPVTLIDGYQTEIAHSLKDRVIILEFWYWLRMPCGHFKEVDIREIPQIWSGEVEAELTRLYATPEALPYVASLFSVVPLQTLQNFRPFGIYIETKYRPAAPDAAGRP